MLILISLLVSFAVIALLALGFAFLLDKFARAMGLKKRAFLAGFLASALPMAAFSIGPIFNATNAQDNLLIVFLPLLVGIAVMTAFVGYPSAYFFSRSRMRRRAEASDPGIFE